MCEQICGKARFEPEPLPRGIQFANGPDIVFPNFKQRLDIARFCHGLFQALNERPRPGELERVGSATQLVDVVWLPDHDGRKLKVTSVNGVSEKLKAVSAELDKLQQEGLIKYLMPSGGTYNCRTIAGTTSRACTGTALPSTSMSPGRLLAEREAYRREVPLQGPHPLGNRCDLREARLHLGGKWYRYDTMHFEYRPELLP